MSKGHIAIDFDGTLAISGTKIWDGPLGEPIPGMINRVKQWIDHGYEFRIFTARVAPYDKDGTKQSEDGLKEIRDKIGEWCEKHIGKRFEVVCCKDHNTLEIWDDKAKQVIRDTGEMC